MEKIDPDEIDFDNMFINQVQHRELAKVRMSDLILTYNLNKKGIQTITLVLTHFDVTDKSMIKTLSGKFEPMIPDVYAHIVTNPEFIVNRGN